MRYAIALLLIPMVAWAGQVGWNNQQVTYEDKYSHKDFTNVKFVNINLESGTTIYASCFSKEVPDFEMFPATMTGITFLECNMDNVKVPPGNLVNNFYKPAPIKFKAQNDLRDWQLNQLNQPVKLIDEDDWKAKGYSIDPAAIPLQPITSFDQIPKVSGTAVEVISE